MNQKQAKHKLEKLAKGKGLSILGIEWWNYRSGEAKIKHYVYVNGSSWHSAPTWEEAFEKLEEELEELKK